MSRQVARNVLSTALDLDRAQAGWVAVALTDAEIARPASPKSTDVPEADDIRRRELTRQTSDERGGRRRCGRGNPRQSQLQRLERERDEILDASTERRLEKDRLARQDAINQLRYAQRAASRRGSAEPLPPEHDELKQSTLNAMASAARSFPTMKASGTSRRAARRYGMVTSPTSCPALRTR